MSSLPRERIKCLFCDSTFRDNFNLRRHINSKHPEEAKEILKVNCSLCGLIYIRKKDDKPAVEMCNDCKKRTDIAPPESHNFVSENEFKTWKEKLELETSTRYMKSRRSYNLRDGTVKTEFPCYRSSFLSPKNKRLKLKLLATKKNAFCPAKMICEFKPEGEVSVQFFSQHKGHSLDANKMLMKEKKKEKPKKVEKPPVPTSASAFPNFSMQQPDLIMTDDNCKSLSNDEYMNTEYNNDIDLVLSQIENEGEITSNGKKWLSSFCNAVQNLASNKNTQFLPFKSSKPSKKVLRDNNVAPEQSYEAPMSNKMTEEERQSIIQMVLDDL